MRPAPTAALLAATAILLALTACQPGASVAPTGSTLRSTWIDQDGNGTLEPGPGEPVVDRTELATRSRPVRQLARFAQLTDAHVTDEESPARVPFLDRYGAPLTSSFRPQEALTLQVLAATVRSINAMRPQAVLETGDLIDNDQADELTQSLAVLRGGRVDPDSGAPGYDGVQATADADPFYYRPDLDAPRHRGLLERAQRSFTSPGLRAPWYPTLGNHDILVQGVAAPTAETERLAVGNRAVREPPPGRLPRQLTPQVVDQYLRRARSGPLTAVPADPGRQELAAAAVLARLRAASGHGGTGSLLDYSFDLGPHVRVITLDLVRRGGGADGVVRPQQVTWLHRELAGAGRRWVLVVSHQPLDTAAGAGPALGLLAHDPYVVAAIAAHTHRNRVVATRTPAGGYWSITTASLDDYPQQARAYRLVATADGGVALDTWMLDHVPDHGLADTSRQLAYLDAQGGRPSDYRGGRLDRNVRLFKAPVPVRR